MDKPIRKRRMNRAKPKKVQRLVIPWWPKGLGLETLQIYTEPLMSKDDAGTFARSAAPCEPTAGNRWTVGVDRFR